MASTEKRAKSCAKQKGLAKTIARHSLTGLNIIIFHDGLFDISYCHYNQQEKLQNNFKIHFENLSIS